MKNQKVIYVEYVHAAATIISMDQNIEKLKAIRYKNYGNDELAKYHEGRAEAFKSALETIRSITN